MLSEAGPPSGVSTPGSTSRSYWKVFATRPPPPPVPPGNVLGTDRQLSRRFSQTSPSASAAAVPGVGSQTVGAPSLSSPPEALLRVRGFQLGLGTEWQVSRAFS